MRLYNETEPIHMETDISGLGLGDQLLKIRDGMSFPRNKAHDNAALLHPIAFVIKSFTSTETRYSETKKKHLEYHMD